MISEMAKHEFLITPILREIDDKLNKMRGFY